MSVAWLLMFCFGAIYLENELAVSLEVRNGDLNTIIEWKYLDYEYESEEQKQSVLNSTGYVRENNFPIDVDVWYIPHTCHRKIFVTVPRGKGVPSTLNTVSNKRGDGGPLLKPYPDWSLTKPDCNGIYSVYRIAIWNNYLYVLDNGKLDDDQICPPKLICFDLITDEIVKNVVIPNDIAFNSTTGEGFLVTPIVVPISNIQPPLSNHVYIADVSGHALIDYNGFTNQFRRLTSSAMDYDPAAVTYTIEGQSFDLEDGIVGMAVSPLTQRLYASPMSSYNMISANASDIQFALGNNVNFKVYEDILPTQSSVKAFSGRGILFFALVNSTSIACWNEDKPLQKENMIIIAENSESLQFTSGLKVVQDPIPFSRGEYLWALTNRYQKIATGTLNITEVNFRILNQNVLNLVIDSRCLFWL